MSDTAIATSAGWERMQRARENGSAICPNPGCLDVHIISGRMHLNQSWSMRPRCRHCGTALVMPWREGQER